MTATSATTGTTNAALQAWVDEVAALTTPDKVVWITGSDEEIQGLNDELVAAGTFVKLDESKKPNSYWAASDPSDVARVEDRTFIASEKEEDAGFTNNWMAPAELKAHHDRPLQGVHDRPHDVRHPLRHGPPRRRPADVRRRDHRLRLCRRVSMKIMARIGEPVLRAMEEQRRELRQGPALGRLPAHRRRQADVKWPCSDTKYIAHFPETREIWSYGSGYGGNALLGKKCYALRIASAMARDEAGWPSTCSSSSSPPRPARSTTSPAPSRAPAARPTSR
jgi:phosphoenolpyruvate carboxykinase (GTP)